MASGIYTTFKEYAGDATVDLDGHTFKVILLDDSHAFSAAHSVLTDVNTNELENGNGYTTGGAELASVTWAADSTTMKWDAADTSWAAATFTAYHAVIYDDTHASDALVCSIDFGGAKSVASGTFTIQWDSTGILRLA